MPSCSAGRDLSNGISHVSGSHGIHPLPPDLVREEISKIQKIESFTIYGLFLSKSVDFWIFP